MDALNTSRTNMIRTTCSYCDDHAAATAGIPDFAPTVTKIKNKLVLIDALDILSSGSSKGVTLDTDALRNVMQVDTVKLCGGLKALAGATNNNEMFVAADWTEPKLEKLPKDKVDDICEGIQQLAAANAAALVPKGIIATDITDTATAISLYRASMTDTRNKIVEIKNAGEQIPPIIREIIDNLLKRQLDQMANTLKTSNFDFFNGYYLSREIIDPATHPTQIKANFFVKGVTPKKPIPNAELKLNSDTNSYKLEGGVAATAEAKVKNGTFVGEAIAPGFKAVILDPFDVKLGKTVEIDIEMELN